MACFGLEGRRGALRLVSQGFRGFRLLASVGKDSGLGRRCTSHVDPLIASAHCSFHHDLDRKTLGMISYMAFFPDSMHPLSFSHSLFPFFPFSNPARSALQHAFGFETPSRTSTDPPPVSAANGVSHNHPAHTKRKLG